MNSKVIWNHLMIGMIVMARLTDHTQAAPINAPQDLNERTDRSNLENTGRRLHGQRDDFVDAKRRRNVTPFNWSGTTDYADFPMSQFGNDDPEIWYRWTNARPTQGYIDWDTIHRRRTVPQPSSTQRYVPFYDFDWDTINRVQNIPMSALTVNPFKDKSYGGLYSSRRSSTSIGVGGTLGIIFSVVFVLVVLLTLLKYKLNKRRVLMLTQRRLRRNNGHPSVTLTRAVPLNDRSNRILLTTTTTQGGVMRTRRILVTGPQQPQSNDEPQRPVMTEMPAPPSYDTVVDAERPPEYRLENGISTVDGGANQTYPSSCVDADGPPTYHEAITQSP